MSDKRYTMAEIKAMKDLFGQKNDPASLTGQPGQLHGLLQDGSGNAGVFYSPGYRPAMYSTLSRPRSFASAIGVSKSEYINEKYEILTGATAASGTNATGWCGNPPSLAPYLKTCRQVVEFGQFFAKTELQQIPEVGKLVDRADVPRDILNASPEMHPLIPDIMWRLEDTRSQLQGSLYRFGIGLERSLERVLVQGSAALAYTATQLGFTKEFNGVEQLVKTGYTDVGGATCPAADSTVINWGNANIGDSIGSGDTRTIHEVITDAYYAKQDDLPEQIGMAGFNGFFLMRKELFRELVYQIACTYATYRCGSTARRESGDAMALNQLRLDMQRGQYLLIDGVEVPVIFSDGIPRNRVAANTYESDLFFLPASFGGDPLLRLEYFDMGNPYATELANFAGGNDYAVLNNGMYALTERHNGFCREILVAAQMRLILETPFLAFRVDNIQFAYRAPTRDAYPDESLYVDGGVTYKSA